jgi:hypothetical protein
VAAENLDICYDIVLQRFESRIEDIKSLNDSVNQSMIVRFILAIFIQMFHKRSQLDLEVLHRVFRILLAIRFEDETEYQDLQTLYLEILDRVHFSLAIVLLKDLYNEFKFEATMEMNLDEKVYFNLSFLIGFIANFIKNETWNDPPVDEELFSFFLNFE